MSKAGNVHHASRLAGIFLLAAGTAVLATEDPDCFVEDDGERVDVLEKITPKDEGRVDSAQGRGLNLMFLIWTLKNNSSDIK